MLKYGITPHFNISFKGILRVSTILILESSLKTARLWRAVFRLQSREFAPFGRELSALKLILRIAVRVYAPSKCP